jgi:hypothetical protein
MERRKFLIGMGSLAAGGAAAMGTGAFSTQATRSFAVDVVGDSSAYLGLDASSSSYVSDSGGTISIDLGSDSGDGGSGINQYSQTLIRPAFDLQNQGRDDLYVEIDNPLANNDMTTSTTNESLANGGIDVTVPAGIDVQFLGATAVPPSGSDLALVGRDTGTGSSLGGDFDAPYSNEYYTPYDADPETNSGNRIPINEDALDAGRGAVGAGAIKLTPGDEVSVICRVTTTEVDSSVPDVDFTVEAYSSKDSLSYSVVDLV